MSCTDIVCGTGIGNITKPGDPDNTSVLSAVGVSGGINVSWTYPTINPYAVAYVDVYRSDSNNIANAIKRVRISGDFFFDRIAASEIKPYYYWIKIISINGTEGEFIGSASAIPSGSVQEVLDQINGTLDESYLTGVLREKINKISTIEVDLASEVSKRLLQNATMGEALAAVQSETGQALTYIQDEITQRVSANEALLNSVNALSVGMSDNAAAIVAEQTVRATADTALASDITTLYSNVASNTAAISAESTARTDAVSSLATAVNSVTAIANAKNKTFSQAAAPTIDVAVGDLWFDTDDGNKPYRYSGTFWVATDDARIAANMASISSEATARADADTAIASSVTSLTSAVATKVKTYRQISAPNVGMTTGDIWFDSDDNNKMYRFDGTDWVATDDSRIASNVAAINSEATARANADSTLATSISTIQTQLSSSGVTGAAIIQAQTTANTAVTNAETAQTTANNASTAAGTAQTTANTAVTNAATAQTTANTAVSDASSALSKLTDIASDSLLTPDEKPSIIAQRDVIMAEQAGIDAKATSYGITTEKTAYDTAVSALTTYLATLTAPVLWSTLTGNTTIVGTTFRTKFNDVYTTRQALLNAILAAAKTRADAAQTTANTAVTNAATAQAAANAAQTTANNAVTAAATAQTAANTANTAIANIVSDSILSASEKPSQRQEWDVVSAEKAGLNSQAVTFGITTENTTYNNAFQALATYLNNGTTWSSGIPSWLADADLSVDTVIVGATYRSTWASLFAARTSLLNAIAAKAKTLADTAQTQANTATSNAATAQSTANTAVTNAATAQTTANTAVSNAATAQAAANAAQSTANTASTNANSALTQLTDIASDSVLTPDEKPSIIAQRDAILAEQAGIDTTATTFGITTEKTAYDNAVSALTTYLATLTAPVLWSMLTGNTTIVGTTFRTKFNDVYTTRQALLNAISAKAKTLADTAQTQANTAVANAAAAQTTANTAVTNAATAQTAANTANATLADIASDSMLTPVEKSSVRAEWDVIAAEKAGLNSQATTFSTTTENTTYNTSFQALATYLNNGTAWASGIPSWISDANLSVTTTIVGATFRTKFSDYYTARTALLNAISVKAKTLADTAQVQANTATTNAATAQGTADTKIKTFFQTTAPVASTVGDLWVDIDDNNHIYRWSGIAWIDAHDARITSTASTVSTLQTTVGNHTTSIQTAANSIDGLSAQYTVKVDNNGYVSGFGLASTPKDGTPYSEFAVLANTFKIGAPDGAKTPFAVVDTGGGVYKTLLNSDVLIGGNVDIANLTTGSLPNNVKLSLGGGVIDLDGAGEIRVFKSLDENADYVRLSAGELRFLRYVGGSYQTYNFLSRLETGIANSGSSVEIPGYWKVQPKVMVSPAMMNLYKKDYGNQDQAINCQALNIRETAPGSGQWMFDANATLSLAASSGGTALNISSGAISSNTFTTATQSTPANCTSITPSFSLSSSRGNGSSQYYHRSVRWRVEYFNGSIWVNGSWNTVNMGDQVGSVTASGTFNFPSAGTWQWRIGYEAFDTDGTVFGAVSYIYSQSTCPASSGGSGTASWNSPVNLSIPFSVSGSGEIYKIDYVYAITIGMTYLYSNSEVVANLYDLIHATYNPNPHYAFGLSAANSTSRPLSKKINETQTVTGNNLSVSNLPFKIERFSGSDQYTNVTANVNAADCYAVVYRRSVVANSTIPTNGFILNSYTYSLSSAQVLATGSMNWLAVGE